MILTSRSKYRSKLVTQDKKRSTQSERERPLLPTDVMGHNETEAPTESDIERIEQTSDVLVPTSVRAHARDADRRRAHERGEAESSRSGGDDDETPLLPCGYN